MTLPSLQGNKGGNVGAAGLHGFYQAGQLAGEATSPASLEESGAWIKKFNVAQYCHQEQKSISAEVGYGLGLRAGLEQDWDKLWEFLSLREFPSRRK